MAIQILCTDLDGTLLNNQKEIAPADVAAIARWQATGRLFGITSGRQETGVARALRALVRPDFVVCLNGALVIKTDGQRKRRPLTAAAAARVITVMMQASVQQIVVTFQGLSHPLDMHSGRFAGIDPAALPGDGRGIDKLSAIIKDPQARAKLMLALQQLPVTTTHSDTDYLEVTGPGVTKASGLRVALGAACPLTQVAAVGDYGNDEEMIKQVGIGYAVANATPRLKAVADRLTVANTDAPISHIVNDLLDPKN